MFIATSDSPQGPGILVLQHENFDKRNPKWSIDMRGSIRAVRIRDRLDRDLGLGQWTYDTESAGDIHGGQLLKKTSRPIPMWRFATPVIVADGSNDVATPSGGKGAGIDLALLNKTDPKAKGAKPVETKSAGGGTCATLNTFAVLPIFGAEYEADNRLQVLLPFARRGKKKHWPKFPRDFVGISLTADDERTQVDLFHPTDPRLIAVNRKGDALMGTWVCDMGDGFKVDPDRCARLQSAWRVVRPKSGCVAVPDDPDRPGKKLNAIAWQLGPAHCDQAWGRGIVVDQDLCSTSTSAEDKRIVALSSRRETGPFDVGQKGDKHEIGQTEDGEPINSLHIPTTALYKLPCSKDKDAPLEFLGDYITPTPGPLYVPVELRYDGVPDHGFVCGTRKGLWRWEARTFIYAPPTDGPRPGIPRETTGGGVPNEREGGTVFEENDPVVAAGPWVSGDGHEQFSAVTMQLAAPALLFRPQDLRSNALDLRVHADTLPPSALLKHDTFTPMVLRAEAFAASQAKGWDYTTGQRPCRGRWRGGTSDGGIVFLPPEVSIDDHASSYAPAGRTRSTGYVVAGPNVYFAAGLPDVARGDVDTGYRWGAISGGLRFDQLGSDGTATQAMELTSSRGLTLDIIDAGLRINNQVDRAGTGIGTVRNTPNAAGGDPAIWIPINVGGVEYGWPLWAL